MKALIYYYEKFQFNIVELPTIYRKVGMVNMLMVTRHHQVQCLDSITALQFKLSLAASMEPLRTCFYHNLLGLALSN